MRRKVKARNYLEPCPERVQKPGVIKSPARVPPKGEWRENPDIAFGIRIRVNLAIPAVWPM